MLDKATVLTTIFTIVDDTMKGSATIQHALERPGPAPRLSDSELVTIALYQELIGEPREDHFFRLHQASLRTFFPGLNERSRYNRRKRDLWSVILAVRISLQVVLDALELEETAAIDSAPVPCVGYKRTKHASDFAGMAEYGVCSSKAMKYFGLKLHSVVSLTGVVMGRSRSPEPVTTITRPWWNCLTRLHITSSVCLEMEPTMMRPSRTSWSSIALWSYSPRSSSTNSPSAASRLKSSSIGCGSSAKR
jgi:hypothetical protein